jgi:hypothetical protein
MYSKPNVEQEEKVEMEEDKAYFDAINNIKQQSRERRQKKNKN